MPAFEYRALDAQGREKRGLLQGDAPRQIRQVLRDQGLTPLAVELVKEVDVQKNWQWQPSLSVAQLALFTRQFATLLRAGLPIESALQAISEQSPARPKRLALRIRASVMEGLSLAESLRKQGKIFDKIYIASIESGEQAGKLDDTLDRLADFVETQQQNSQKVGTALVYPAVLFVAAIAVTIAMLTTVVPKMVEMFDSFKVTLPWGTQKLIALSVFLQNHWFLLLILFLIFLILAAWLWRIDSLKFTVQNNFFKFPVFGKLLLALETARLTRTLGVLLAGGVPMLEALKVSAQAVGTLPFREGILSTAQRVREGEPLSKSLQKTKLLPPIALHLIASGETSGQLEVLLQRAAAQQERELQTLTQTLLSLLTPLMTLFMGGVVLTIVITILMPMLDISQVLQNTTP